jgi:large-conductance mechanosensitive channel
MRCPYCDHENADGRKYCRACGKPLAPETVNAGALTNSAHITSPSSTTDPISVSPPAPVVNGMAIASLALSFLAFILPLGIAAAVMGHMSRSQIARSRGRQTGAWLAFSGLVITYLQFAVVAVVCLSIAVALENMNQNIDRNRHARAALLEAIYSYHRPTPADYAHQRRDAVEAMRLIHAGETSYLAAHPDEGYACQMYQLATASPEELNMHIKDSHYEVKIDQCRGADVQHLNDRVYAVVAIPRSDSNPPESPAYCVDQTGVIRSYAPATINDLHQVIYIEHKSCPESGEPAE